MRTRRLRIWVARRLDPFGFRTESYKEMALDNADEALRIADELETFAYPEPPAPGVDYEEVEVTPEARARLTARMQEVYVYAARERRQRERRSGRRRRLATSAAAGALILSSCAGASALLTGTTGVSAIDKILDMQEMHGSKEQPFRSVTGLTRSDFRGVFDYEHIVVKVRDAPVPEDQTTVTAFVKRERVCTLTPQAGDLVPYESATVGCASQGAISYGLRDFPVLPWGVTGGRSGVVTGFASPRVKALTGRGPGGKLYVRLSDPWVPSLLGLGAVRVFAASTPRSDPRLTARRDRLFDLRNYELTALLTNGKEVVWKSRNGGLQREPQHETHVSSRG